MEYAGFWIRFGAYIIDVILLYIVQLIIGIVFGVSAGAMAGLGDAGEAAVTGATLIVGLLSLVISVGYFVIMESGPYQGTLGKKAVGIIVTDENGGRITPMRALGRYLGKILSSLILLIGYIMVAFTDKKQGLHDMLASTLVLKGQPGDHSTDGVFD